MSPAVFVGKNKLDVMIERDIVQDLIADLLVDIDDERLQLTHKRALAVFKLFAIASILDYSAEADRQEQDSNCEAHSVKLKSVMFKMVLEFLSKGATF